MRGEWMAVAVGIIGLAAAAPPATAADGAQAHTAAAATSAPGAAAITSLDTVAAGTEALAGRYVRLRNARVEGIDKDGNFIVGTGSRRILVVPAVPPAGPLDVNNAMDVEGTVMKMTPQLTADLRGHGVNAAIYIYALGVRQ